MRSRPTASLANASGRFLLTKLRTQGRPWAALTLLVHAAVTVTPAVSWAQGAPPSDQRLSLPDPDELAADEAPANDDVDTAVTAERSLDPLSLSADEARELSQDIGGAQQTSPDAISDVQGAAPAEETGALPTGVDKSGVTSQAISVPKCSGSINGISKSLSAQLSAGIASAGVGSLS